MRTITKEEAITLHRKMWNEIADMIKEGIHYSLVMEYKREALDRLGVERGVHERPLNHCYCCEYSEQNAVRGVHGCPNCPLEWSTQERVGAVNPTCGWDDSPYSKFVYALPASDNFERLEKLEQYAREVANLPERTEV